VLAAAPASHFFGVLWGFLKSISWCINDSNEGSGLLRCFWIAAQLWIEMSALETEILANELETAPG